MSSKISEAAPSCPDCSTPLLFECVGCSKTNYPQGEAVPVASEPAPNWCRTCGRRPNDPLAVFCLDTHHRNTHPQPAALNEVSGDSGELPPLPKSRFVTDRYSGTSFASYTTEQMQDYARAALAATGKQQVGENNRTTVDSGALQMALNVLRRAGKGEVAETLESTAMRGQQVSVETCEAGQPECGPVTNHDSEGVPLCAVCWEGLLADTYSGDGERDAAPGVES